MGRCWGFRRRALERGQGSIEYIGLAAIVAVCLAVGLHLNGALSWVIYDSTDDAMSKGLCLLFADADCEQTTQSPTDGQTSADEEPEEDYEGPPWLDPSLTPLEAATWGDYVALGDSYSSGEGGSDYEDDSDTVHLSVGCGASIAGENCEEPEWNTCHRSEAAYGQQLAEGIDFEGDFTFAACSGAVTDDFTEANEDQAGEDAQLDHVDEDTSLITLSVGGNDAHFSSVVKDCVLAGVDPDKSCGDSADETREDIDEIKDDLVDLLEEAREKAPNARIIVVGYPRFFPDPPSGGDGSPGIDTADQQYLNEMARYANDVIADAVEEAGGTKGGFEFVDTYDAFEGCEIGTDDGCMNSLEVGSFNGVPPASEASFHPNDKGHEKLAELIEQQIREGQ